MGATVRYRSLSIGCPAAKPARYHTGPTLRPRQPDSRYSARSVPGRRRNLADLGNSLGYQRFYADVMASL